MGTATADPLATGRDLRPSAFTLIADSWLEGWYLAFDTLSGRLLTLREAQATAAADVLAAAAAGRPGPPGTAAIAARLAGAGMLVPAGTDQRAEVRRRYHAGRGAARGLSLTVAPTVACNLRCGYCFQEHPERRMGDDDVARLRAHVEAGLTPGTSLSVTWFGGEPLMGFDVLRSLAPWFERIARERDCTVRQSLITNGMLLDDRRVEYLAGLASFDHAQVTLDGPRAVHDRRRPAAGGRGTFDRILRNVAAAAGRLSVALRVNVDRTNCGELEALVSALEDAGLRNRVHPYLGHTTDYTDVCAGVADTVLTRREFAEVDVAFRLHLVLHGWRGIAPLPRPAHGPLCVVDHPGGAVVAPGGAVFRCWNEVAQAPATARAHLDPEGTPVPGAHDDWAAFDPFTHAPCHTCRAQPLCRGGCPWEARKHGPDEPGNCVTERYVLADRLRLHHLERTLHRGVDAALTVGCQ